MNYAHRSWAITGDTMSMGGLALISEQYAREVRWVACWVSATGSLVTDPDLTPKFKAQIARLGLGEATIRKANALSKASHKDAQ